MKDYDESHHLIFLGYDVISGSWDSNLGGRIQIVSLHAKAARTECINKHIKSVSFAESAALYLLLLILKLIVESAFVTVVSYLPFVAPFWFIPDELSRVRYFVGQGTRIVAESLGVLFYIAFFIASTRLIARRTSMPTADREQSQ